MNDKITKALEEAWLLGRFKAYCQKYSFAGDRQRLRNMLSRSADRIQTIQSLFRNEFHTELTRQEAERILTLLLASLNKVQYRKKVPEEVRSQLMSRQNFKCAFCKEPIDGQSHVDHIIPFTYVGDELEDNLQMLCSHCNQAKNASIDYQIRVLLELV